MKKYRLIHSVAFIALIILTILTLNACGGGSSDGGGEEIQPEASAIIGPDGGTVEVTDPTSPLYGVKIEIPPNALAQETTITISKAVNPPPFPSETENEELVVDIGPAGTIFDVPATIKIPYKDIEKGDFLAVFVAEGSSEEWIHHSFYTIEPTLDIVTFQVSHLSLSQVNDPTKVIPGKQCTFFFRGGSKNLTDTKNETSKDTIREVIKNRTWKQMTDCIEVIFQEVNRESEADIIIQWDNIADLFWPELQNGNIIFKKTLIPAQMSYPTSVAYTLKPKIITLNEKISMNFHISLDGDVENWEFDLFSIIAHEFGHILGLPDYYNPEHDVTYGRIKKGDVVRHLNNTDEAQFEARYSIIILDCIPTGTISDRRPNISAKIKSPCNFSFIDTTSIELYLNGVPVSYSYTVPTDGSEVIVYYTPEEDLSDGRHIVDLHASDLEGRTEYKPWTFEIEGCANIAGNWAGTATFEEENVRVTIILSQDKCKVTGTIESTAFYPCEIPPITITGSVSGNIFSFIVPESPLVDSETCEIICYGTDQGSLTIDGNRMYGGGTSEDCEYGGFDEFLLDLKRSSSESSFETRERKWMGRSSLFIMRKREPF